MKSTVSDATEHPIVGTAERLRKKKRYGDVLLFSWGLVEQEIDSVLAQRLGYSDKKLEDTPFMGKIAALVVGSCLTEDEARKIAHFKQKRDAVFHDYTSTIMWASGDQKNGELADIGIEALKASTNACIRNLKPLRQTSEVSQYFLSFKTA